MAFGITRNELVEWKLKVLKGEISFLTHYWEDARFPQATSVTKVGCSNLNKLARWGRQYGLKETWIHHTKYPHFDLFVPKQKVILELEGLEEHIKRFHIR